MQLRNTILVSVALVFIALGLGVSVGYSISPVMTRTTTQIQTLATTLTETLPTTVTQTVPTTVTVVALSGQTYTLYTVTAKIVVVYLYLPECVTISGQASTTYVSPIGGQSTTITYTSPSGITYSGAVTFTTVTNNTATFSDRTQSESISC